MRRCTAVGLSALFVLGAFPLTGCVSAPTQAEVAAEADLVELHRDGRFIVSAQPNEATLAAVASEGVTTIINCRSTEETEGLAFDEAAVAGSLGMTYVHVPMGRDDGYSPEQAAAFIEAIEAADGDVYVHCASGGRARTAIMAYLIRAEGASVDDAMATSRRLGASEPILDRLLGQSVRYDLAAESSESAD